MTLTQPARPRPERKSTEPTPGIARLSTIIASVPGVAEQSLRATLESLPSVEVVGSAAGCLSALQMVRDRQADLVIVDSNLPLEDVQVFLQQLKQEGLQTHSLVLTATRSQARQALAAGADATFRRDGSGRQLSAAVGKLGGAKQVDGRESTGRGLTEGPSTRD